MRKLIFAVSLILLASTASAQSNQGELEPGLIKADSPIYGLDVAFDRGLAMTPFSDPGEVAAERASEIAVAEERNNTEAREQAEQNLNEIAERATSDHSLGLQKAAAVLEAVNGSVPEQAQQGISQALDQVRQAQNRTPDRGMIPDFGSSNRTENGTGPGGGRPDLDVPGR
ncbi:hypothetical protein ACM16X_02725 [Haloarcula japonica]|uniref:hypothetical protein n=1 Tax=Haloarcula japonica TaxID=29282 RepID=UPI0039F6ECC4